MKLSKYQTEILDCMKKNGYFIGTNEGKDLKCWLEDSSGNFIKTVRITTVQILANQKKIVPLEEDKYKDKRNVFLWRTLS